MDLFIDLDDVEDDVDMLVWLALGTGTTVLPEATRVARVEQARAMFPLAEFNPSSGSTWTIPAEWEIRRRVPAGIVSLA